MEELATDLGEPADYLFWLRRETDAVREALDQQQRVVVACRKLGISWAEIGKAMRVSKQAAQQKYGQKAPWHNASDYDEPLPGV